MSDLKKQLIKLGSTNPELRPHIRKILKTASGPHPLDIKRSIVSFEVEMAEYEIEEDAEDPRSDNHELAKKIMADSYAAVRLEGDFLKELSRMLGVPRIMDEGHGPHGSLYCKFGVDSFQDVVNLNKALHRYHMGGDDRIGGNTPYYYAEGFVLYPEGVNGPRYGSESGMEGDLEEWLDLHKV